jgi:hypothetical protein
MNEIRKQYHAATLQGFRNTRKLQRQAAADNPALAYRARETLSARQLAMVLIICLPFAGFGLGSLVTLFYRGMVH